LETSARTGVGVVHLLNLLLSRTRSTLTPELQEAP